MNWAGPLGCTLEREQRKKKKNWPDNRALAVRTDLTETVSGGFFFPSPTVQRARNWEEAVLQVAHQRGDEWRRGILAVAAAPLGRLEQTAGQESF
jgi:hypothetical protein